MKSAAVLFLFFPVLSWSEQEFQGIEWMEKYLDANGCIAIERLIESKTKVKNCPKEFSPQIRPMIVGALRLQDQKKKLCCYTWKTLGNR